MQAYSNQVGQGCECVLVIGGGGGGMQGCRECSSNIQASCWQQEPGRPGLSVCVYSHGGQCKGNPLSRPTCTRK
jgi:hypothetical protein